MADRTIFVILGAGASRGCFSRPDLEGQTYVKDPVEDPDSTGLALVRPAMPASYADPDYLPPLVTDLFDWRWQRILNSYPMVRAAAPELRLAAADSPGLEAHLRDRYELSADPDDLRTFRSFAPYMQELLLAVSREYCAHPDNYALLASLLLRRFARVVFVTMNYDVLLEIALRDRASLEHISEYISDRRAWSVVKPHGCVLWGRRIENYQLGIPYADPPDDLYLSKEIFHHWPYDLELESVRHRGGGGRYGGEDKHFFPSLSVPLGPGQKQYACPDSHLEFFMQQMSGCEELDFLCIGYSGLDPELFDLIRKVGRPVRSLYTVAKDRESAAQATRSTLDHLGLNRVPYLAISHEDFNGCLRQGDFENWLQTVGSGQQPQSAFLV